MNGTRQKCALVSVGQGLLLHSIAELLLMPEAQNTSGTLRFYFSLCVLQGVLGESAMLDEDVLF